MNDTHTGSTMRTMCVRERPLVLHCLPWSYAKQIGFTLSNKPWFWHLFHSQNEKKVLFTLSSMEIRVTTWLCIVFHGHAWENMVSHNVPLAYMKKLWFYIVFHRHTWKSRFYNVSWAYVRNIRFHIAFLRHTWANIGFTMCGIGIRETVLHCIPKAYVNKSVLQCVP